MGGRPGPVFVPGRLVRDGESSHQAAVRLLRSGWKPADELDGRLYEYLMTSPEAGEARVAAEVVGTPAPKLASLAESPAVTAGQTRTPTETPTRPGCVVCGASLEGRRRQTTVCSDPCWQKKIRSDRNGKRTVAAGEARADLDG